MKNIIAFTKKEKKEVRILSRASLTGSITIHSTFKVCQGKLNDRASKAVRKGVIINVPRITTEMD